jgi:hypothetical protein
LTWERNSVRRHLAGTGLRPEAGPATSVAGPPHTFSGSGFSDRPKSASSRGGRNSCRGRTPSPAC